MDEEIDSQTPQTSSGAGWLDLLKEGIKIGGAAAIANNKNKPTPVNTPSEPVNMKLILGIGAGVLVLIIALFAFKK